MSSTEELRRELREAEEKVAAVRRKLESDEQWMKDDPFVINFKRSSGIAAGGLFAGVSTYGKHKNGLLVLVKRSGEAQVLARGADKEDNPGSSWLMGILNQSNRSWGFYQSKTMPLRNIGSSNARTLFEAVDLDA